MSVKNTAEPRSDHRSDHPVLRADPEPETTQLLTAEQVGERWQVPRTHVYRLTREGKLSAVELGRYRRFRLAAIEAFEAGGGTAGHPPEG